MRAYAGLVVLLLLAGSIPLLWTEEAGADDGSVPPARGNTIVVDIIGNGDYTSIKAAIKGSSSGDVIRIYDGNYSEYFTIDKSLTLIGNGTSSVLFSDHPSYMKNNNIVISNLRIISNQSTSIVIEKQNNINIEDCIFEGICGLSMNSLVNVTIKDNRFYTKFPILFYNDCNDIKIINNNFYLFDLNLNGKLMTLKGNIFHNCSISIEYINHFDTWNIDSSNIVNGKYVYFVKDRSNFEVEDGYSQYYFINCSYINVRNINSTSYCSGFLFYACDNITLESVNVIEDRVGMILYRSTNVIMKEANFLDTDAIFNIDGNFPVMGEIINCTFNNAELSIGGNCQLQDSEFSNSRLRLAGIIKLEKSYFFNTEVNFEGPRIDLNNCDFESCKDALTLYGDEMNITKNNFNYNEKSIYVTYVVKECRIDENIFTNNTIGISSSRASNGIKKIIISNSTFKDNGILSGCAINIVPPPPHTMISEIINCQFEDNGIGINITDNTNIISIRDNLFKKNKAGIRINGYEVDILNNHFINNDAGIVYLSYNSKTIRNYFVENKNQIIPGDLTNSLSNLKDGGNFWSDYHGVDQKRGLLQDQWGSDGYGDEPNRMGNMVDKYPLIFDTKEPTLIIKDIEIDEGDFYLFDSQEYDDDNLVMYVNWTFIYNNTQYYIKDLSRIFKFNIPGIYEVNVNISDFAKNYNVSSFNIIVNDVLDPLALSQGNLSAIEKSTVWYNGSRSHDTGIISKYEWIFDYKGENHVLEGINVSYFFDKPGIVPVILRVTDSAGHTGEDQFTVTVIDITDPLANAGPDLVIDNAGLVSFDGSLSTDNGELMEYNWTFEIDGVPILIQGLTAEHYFDKPGRYNVTLTVTDQFGNMASDNLTLTVRDTKPPIPKITGLSSFLESENIKLSGSSSTDNGKIANYEWTIIDNGSHLFEGVDLDYKVEFRGNHYVTLTVYDEFGNHAEANLTVNAIDGKKPFTSAGPDQEVAVGTTVTFDGSRSHDDGIITKYEWTFTYDNQKQESVGQVTSFKFEKAGEYDVTLKVYDDNDNYGIDTLTISVKDTGVVKGIVLGPDGKPMGDALVEIVASDGKMYSMKTAPNGEFSIVIPTGSFTWTITKNGYEKITGSGTVTILGEVTLDLSGSPMKKVETSGPGPILFIVPALVILLLIVGIVIFFVIRKKKVPEEPSDPPKEEAMPPTPAEGGAEAGIPTPPPTESEFTQSPPVMEDPIPEDKAEENTSIDDPLEEKVNGML